MDFYKHRCFTRISNYPLRIVLIFRVKEMSANVTDCVDVTFLIDVFYLNVYRFTIVLLNILYISLYNNYQIRIQF